MFAGLCQLSGQALATATENQTIVVTPSGHVCFKNLLLTKLAENGGVDPFEAASGDDKGSARPLSEDDLIEVSRSGTVVPPRPNPASSLPSLLGLLQKEYDALVLDLFDTRKALEETRRELSQALYQNDAAVRVVARLSQERDAARQELAQWKASGGDASGAEPATKRLKTEPSGPMDNDIPQSHVDQMEKVRNELHAKRKAMVKAAAAAAPSADALKSDFDDNSDAKNWHKSSCKAILSIASHGNFVATAGKDKQVIVYDSDKKVVLHSFSVSSTITLDMNDQYVVAAHSSTKVTLLDYTDGNTVGSYSIDDGKLVDVRLHPTKAHVIACTSAGAVLVLGITDDGLSLISTFTQSSSTKYTSGVLHPDGLIYASATSTGSIDLWDFKNKSLASTMEDGDESDAITAIEFSNNGYHLASCHASGAVKAWDLRKQKVMTTLNTGDDEELSSVSCLAYDHGGKYLAYGGSSGVVVTTVKEWGVTAKYSGKKITGITWGPSSQWIATSSGSNRSVTFYGSE